MHFLHDSAFRMLLFIEWYQYNSYSMSNEEVRRLVKMGIAHSKRVTNAADGNPHGTSVIQHIAVAVVANINYYRIR